VVGFLGIAGWVLSAMFDSACLRWLVSRELVGGLLGVRFDRDVGQVLVVTLAWFAVSVGVGMVFGLLGIPLTIGVAVASVASDQPVLVMIVGQVAQLSLTLFQYVALMYLGTKFGPAAALSIARRRWSFVDCFSETNGYAARLFGAYFVQWTAALVVAMPLLFGPLVAGVAWAVDALGSDPDPEQVLALAIGQAPLLIGVGVVLGLLWSVFATVWRVWVLGVGAHFVRTRAEVA
jgi:hypothetical protein